MKQINAKDIEKKFAEKKLPMKRVATTAAAECFAYYVNTKNAGQKVNMEIKYKEIEERESLKKGSAFKRVDDFCKIAHEKYPEYFHGVKPSPKDLFAILEPEFNEIN